MYTLEGMKRSSGPAGNFARNGRRTTLSPNEQLFCPHDLPANIISNVKQVSVEPVRHCIKSKQQVYCVISPLRRPSTLNLSPGRPEYKCSLSK